MKEKDKTEKQLAFELINKNILDVIGDAISIQDTDFRILYQNKAHKNIVGNRKGEFCYKAYQNKARVCKKCHLAMTFKDGKIHMLEQSRVTDKGIRHSENTAYPLRDSTGKIVAGMEMVRDVTQRNRAEEALIKEQKMAQDYLDIAGVMFVAINTNQNVTLINKKGCEILSCLDEEIIGKNWFDVFVPELIRAEVKDIFHKFVAGDISLLKYYENPVLTKNREERTIAWHNTVLRDEAGNITGTLSSGTDITDRKKAEEALEKAKDELEIKVKKRTAELERKNIALKEIIKHVDVEKNKLKKDISININRTLMPIIAELESGKAPHKYIELLKIHLEDLQSSFGRNITSANYNLTAREVEICNMIKGGARSKDISNLLNISPETVEKHRKNIRRKVGISNKRVNLFYFLQKM